MNVTIVATFIFPGEKSENKKLSQQQRREDQLAHLNADITAPLSPAPSAMDQLVRQDSMASTSSKPTSDHLPHDVHKFLKFAGMSCFRSILVYLMLKC